MRQQPTFPGFFQAKLHMITSPKDTFIKLPVSETGNKTATLHTTDPKTETKYNIYLKFKYSVTVCYSAVLMDSITVYKLVFGLFCPNAKKVPNGK